MADTVSALPTRGQTLLSGAGRTLAATGQAVKVEGTPKNFADRDSTATGLSNRRSNAHVTMLLVRNVSGIALAAKRLVRWKAGKRGKQVDGYTCITNEEAAGVVDEFIGSAGVPNNDLFWLAVKGPHLMRTGIGADVGNVIMEGDVLTALTAANSTATTVAGSPYCPLYGGLTATTTAPVSICLNQIGRAMTARTTANTGTTALGNVLVDLCIMK